MLYPIVFCRTVLIKYSDNGTSFSANSGETPGAYIGQYTDFVVADSTVFSKYAWSKIKGDKGEIGESLTGKMMYTDPEFRKGLNNCFAYAHAGNVSINRIVKPADCPTTSTHCLEVKTTAATSPGHGGYSQAVMSRASAVFTSRIVAKIPVGYTLNITHNSYGTNSVTTALTPIAGTGRYETYVFRVQCGASGTFSTICYYYLSGSAAPVTWYVASSTVYDMSTTENISAVVDEIKANGFTKVEGGHITSQMLWLTDKGSAPGDNISSVGLSGRSTDTNGKSLPAFWAGGSYADAQAMQSNISMLHNGKSKIGMFHIDTGGVFEAKTNSGESVFKLTAENISPYTSFMQPGSTGSQANTARSLNSNGTIMLPNGIAVPANAKLNIVGELSAMMSAGLQGYVEVRADLKYTHGGVVKYISLGFTSAYREGDLSENGTAWLINEIITPVAATYYIEVTASVSIGAGSGSISASTMSFDATIDSKQMQIGRNGMVFWKNNTKHLYIATEESAVADEPIIIGKGNTDLPGVLVAGSVYSSGKYKYAWGARKSLLPAQRQGVGIYRVIHEINHTKYIATATPFTNSGRCSCSVFNKATTYFDVYISNGSVAIDCDFEFTVIGDNE